MTPAADPAIRDAVPGDLPAIAALQLASWRDAYAGLVPASFLGPTLDDRITAHWAALPGDGWLVLVAAGSDRIEGFVAVRPSGDGEAAAYVDNLHVAPGLRGAGLGRRLLAAAAVRLTARGERAAYLTVLGANTRARAFYRRMGGREGAVIDQDMHGLPMRALRIDWPDRDALAALAQCAP